MEQPRRALVSASAEWTMDQELAGGGAMLVEAHDQRQFCEDAE
jgi:hypothetical protein